MLSGCFKQRLELAKHQFRYQCGFVTVEKGPVLQCPELKETTYKAKRLQVQRG